MRAKFKIDNIIQTEHSETLVMSAVTNGTPEDNTFSKWTPAAKLEMSITNPDLMGTFKPGERFYLDFTKV